jgi:hypothetical protein
VNQIGPNLLSSLLQLLGSVQGAEHGEVRDGIGQELLSLLGILLDLFHAPVPLAFGLPVVVVPDESWGGIKQGEQIDRYGQYGNSDIFVFFHCFSLR